MSEIVTRVNGRLRSCTPSGGESLLHALRERWELRAAKEGCLEGECGACSVLLDGRAVDSCLVPTVAVDGREVQTIEGLSETPETAALQRAIQAHGAVQCGFCTPGMIVMLTDLLRRTTDPTRDEVLAAVTGNICRCTGYAQIAEAALAAARELREAAA